MGQQYERQATLLDGDVIYAVHFNNEFDAVVDAFHYVNGHNHDGSVGNGSPISFNTLTNIPENATTTVSGFMSAGDKTKLDGMDTDATDDQTGAEIKAAYEAEANTNAFTNAEQTKLSNIETAATADQTASEIKTAYESNSNTEAFTTTEQTKLSNIEASATADQTASEIKTAYESNSNTEAFTTTEQTKLSNIEASADVTDTVNVVAALTAGTNVSIATNGTISSTDTNTTYSDGTTTTAGLLSTADKTKLDGIEASATADQTAAEIEEVVSHDNLQGFVDNEHIDWTSSQGATDIHTDNYTDTTYSDGTTTTAGLLSTADKTKLDGIETSADVTDATNVEAAGALMDSEVTNLAAVKAFDTANYATATQGTTADNALPKAGGTISGSLSISTDLTVAGEVDINGEKVPKVFIQSSNPTSGDFEAGDLWWDVSNYACRIAVTVGSGLVWFST